MNALNYVKSIVKGVKAPSRMVQICDMLRMNGKFSISNELKHLIIRACASSELTNQQIVDQILHNDMMIDLLSKEIPE